ncbi:MAG: metallophosphoesterase family protein [Pontibacterium sp.]
MPQKCITFIGTLDGDQHFTESEVLAALANEAETLKLRAEFVGRPATRIFADQHIVLKLRDEIGFSEELAKEWTKNTLEKERRLGVHHPSKTWLLLKDEVTGQVSVGNVTPRMLPLHLIFQHPPATKKERVKYLAWLTHTFELCLKLGKEQGIKLDEGLSNFTLSNDNHVYYVDDEYYMWDGFVSFSAMLAVFIRNQVWLDGAFMQGVGETLSALVDEIFADITARASIAHQLQNAYIPQGKKQKLSRKLCQVLAQPQADEVKNAKAEPHKLLAACRKLRNVRCNLNELSQQYSAKRLLDNKQTLQAQQNVVDQPSVDTSATSTDVAEDISPQPEVIVATNKDTHETSKRAESRHKDHVAASQTDEAVDSERSETLAFSDRYVAVLADIHANQEAFDAVLEKLAEKGITQGIVLGDIVGYGPDPEYCIDRLKALGFAVIKGNHDHGAATGNFERGFSRHAKTVIEWTHKRLDQTYRDWLYYLPPVLETQEWLAVHGAPIDPSFFYGYVYEMTYQDNLDYLREHQRNICLHGHSHMPGAYQMLAGQERGRYLDENIRLGGKRYTLFCPGSVGQPRNGAPLAQFAILDRNDMSIEMCSVPYDVEKTADKMRANGFPQPLWERLLLGQ